jgi:hypothetical protein
MYRQYALEYYIHCSEVLCAFVVVLQKPAPPFLLFIDPSLPQQSKHPPGLCMYDVFPAFFSIFHLQPLVPCFQLLEERHSTWPANIP